MAYLTPSTNPADYVCRVLFIPNEEGFIANIRGLLQTFTFPESFVQEGGITPDETAEAYNRTFDDFCFNLGTCRVIGEIIVFAGATSPYPTLWLDCDGSSLLRSDYPDLFNVIGTTYGAADSAHFNLPDMRGRAPLNQGTGTGLSARAIGDSIGEQEHTLIVSEAPNHTHTDSGHTHVESIAIPTVTSISPGVPQPTAIPGIGATGIGFASLSSSGGNNPHNNMQPSIVISFLIVALQGG